MSFLEHVNKHNIPVYMGCDFNVEHMAGIIGHYLDGVMYAWKEYADFRDTPELINAVKFNFPNNKIICFPDASGVKRGSVDAGVSDFALLRKAGFTIRSRSKNPFIKDRVASVNSAISRGKLVIDTDRCPELTEALEQQIYLDNGMPDKSSGVDHMLDALGYMIAYLMPIRELKPRKMTIVH